MEISNKKINKLLSIQNLISKGDVAVMEKILEFEDFIEELVENYNGEKEKVAELLNKYEELRSSYEEYVQSLVEKSSERNVDDKIKSSSEELLSSLNSEFEKISKYLQSIKDELTSKIDKNEVIGVNKLNGCLNELNDIKSKLIDTVSYIKALRDEQSKQSEDIKIVSSDLKIQKDSQTPKDIRDKLESIEVENEKLSIEAIKNLRRELDELRKIVQSTRSSSGSGIFGGKQLRMESFSFAGDSSTTVFYLPKEPGGKGQAIWANYQGQHLQLGVHFTVANKTFTCVGFTPQTGSVIEGFIII